MEYGGFFIVQRLNLELTGSPAVQRTLLAQHLALHKTHGRAAEDQKQLGVGPLMVDDVLQHGGNGRLCFGKIGILVNDKDKPLIF